MATHQLIMLSGTQLSETLVGVDDTTGLVSVPTTMPVNPEHLASKWYVDSITSDVVDMAILQQLLLGKADQIALDDLDAQKADQTEIARLEASFIPNTEKTVLGGASYVGRVPQLNSTGHIDPSMLQAWPVNFVGSWDFTSATAPTDPVNGSMYVSSTAGTVDAVYDGIAGGNTAVGDFVLFTDDTWALLPTPSVTLDLDMGTY